MLDRNSSSGNQATDTHWEGNMLRNHSVLSRWVTGMSEALAEKERKQARANHFVPRDFFSYQEFAEPQTKLLSSPESHMALAL